MSEDFKAIPNVRKCNIQQLVLNHINEVLLSMGRSINEFKDIFGNVSSSRTTNEAKEIYFERNIIVSEEDILLQTKLNNMHAKKDPAFCAYLMRIGNGQEKTNNCNKIEISNNFIIPFTYKIESLNPLFNITYPDLHTFYSNPSFITSRIILTTKNDFVDEINDMLIHRFPDDATVYTTIDETIEPNDQCQFEDFLHTLHPTKLLPYRLTLKKNCPVILLRNLNPTKGLCNGTRLICHDFKSHVISATISSVYYFPAMEIHVKAVSCTSLCYKMPLLDCQR
ncbi:hypothetical protein H5410_024107, partial [Solanum commersonii]